MTVRTLKSKPFSEIKNLELSYLDDSLSYINNSFTTAEAFDFSLYNALENFNDFTVNNYSYFFLGKKDLFSNWLKPEVKENITTGFISPLEFALDGKASYLYFDHVSVSGTPNLVSVWDASFSLRTVDELKTLGINPANVSSFLNYLFIIEYIPGTNKCYLKHIDGAATFYLYNRRFDPRANGNLGDSADDLWFTTEENLYKQFGEFNYVITGNSIALFLSQNDFVRVSLADSTKLWVSYSNNLERLSSDDFKLIRPTSSPECYQYNIPDEYLGQTVQILEYGRVRSLCPDITITQRLRLIDNKNLLPLVTEDDISYVTSAKFYNNDVNISNYLNTSWISYKDRNFANVNIDKSSYDIESQCLFHLQYNNIDDKFNTTLNIIPLKNNISPENFVLRGDYMKNESNDTPNVDYREYTTLETGSNQEFGSSTITLNYVFYDLEYHVNPGEDLVFSTKSDDESLPGELTNSLYPFINLNINDTNFVKNGAFGSTTPFLADKFKKLQKNSRFSNNGRYLYTWLYQSKDNKYGVWLDRYYYPNLASKQEALRGKVNFDPASFNDIIDKNYINGDLTFISYIENAPYFDKQSDLMIEPNTEYMYSRIGNDEVLSILNEVEPYKECKIPSFISSENSIQKIDNLNVKNSGVLDLNFDMYLSPDKKYGLDIFSNSPTNGITVKNEKDITPFVYTFDNIYNDDNELTNALVHLSNFKIEIVKTIDLKALYGRNEEIKQLILNLPFDDFAILTSESLYIVGYDLLIKERFALSDIFGTNTILKGYIHKNKLYFLCNNTTTLVEYNPVFVLDLEDGKNAKIRELERFSSFSKLAYRTDDLEQTVLYPVYYNEPQGETASDGNLELIGQDSHGKNIYRTISIEKYPLPQELPVGTEVYLSDNTAFDLDYWYYAPTFESSETDIHNSLGIKNLYIDNLGIVYGFPYICTANKYDDSTLYGVREKVKDALYQVENVDLIGYKDKLIDRGDTDIIFASYTKIYAISVDCNNRLAILKTQSNKLETDARVSLLLFDNAKRPIKTVVLGDKYQNLFALDNLKVYDKGNTACFFSLIGTTYNEDTKETSYHSLLIDENYHLIDNEIKTSVSSTLEKTVDYNKILAQGAANTLDFILNLPKNSLLNNKFIYSFNLDNIIAGWYNIHILVDLNGGLYEVYVNDALLPVKQSFIIDKYVYNLKNVFNYPFILGTTIYRNGVTLDKFLNLQDEMPFATTNVRLKNFSMYSKVLEEYERQSLLLSLTDLESLVITLPGGQRNNLEEIIRYFKYNPPANISNTIRINIKNSGITKTSDQQLLSLDILKKINEELACPLTIKEIKFI